MEVAGELLLPAPTWEVSTQGMVEVGREKGVANLGSRCPRVGKKRKEKKRKEYNEGVDCGVLRGSISGSMGRDVICWLQVLRCLRLRLTAALRVARSLEEEHLEASEFGMMVG